MMRNCRSIQWLFCLIFIICNARVSYSYGDPETQYYENQFEQSFNEDHRLVKRQLGIFDSIDRKKSLFFEIL